MQEIKEFLPQREPFLFVEKFLHCDEHLLVARQSYCESFIFAQTDELTGDKYVPSAILLESLVQSGGAGLNKLGLGRTGIFALASFDKVKIRGRVTVPAVVTMKIRTSKAAGKILRQTGSVYMDGNFIMRAAWCCVFMKSKQNPVVMKV